MQGQAVKPDIPSVQGVAGAFTDPGFLTYPAKQISTVSGTPGKGGSYTAVTPLWGTIPTTRSTRPSTRRWA
ncbi:hypothetical protein [Streptomyces sp. 3214.6]|uniref:hypothetical protein n=1 Tax=Streptomyces sp. 3214.6 TaxID=1882757 RepID=UPI000C5FAF34|nr:hypothetical protein [Streptomyces sp. 3214.6]